MPVWKGGRWKGGRKGRPGTDPCEGVGTSVVTPGFSSRHPDPPTPDPPITACSPPRDPAPQPPRSPERRGCRPVRERAAGLGRGAAPAESKPSRGPHGLGAAGGDQQVRARPHVGSPGPPGHKIRRRAARGRVGSVRRWGTVAHRATTRRPGSVGRSTTPPPGRAPPARRAESMPPGQHVRLRPATTFPQRTPAELGAVDGSHPRGAPPVAGRHSSPHSSSGKRAASQSRAPSRPRGRRL